MKIRESITKEDLDSYRAALDSLKNPKKKDISVVKVILIVLYFVFCLIIGLALGYYSQKTGHRASNTSKSKLLLTALLFGGWFFVSSLLQIIIHEGGHLLFGLLTGYHFISFRVGSFTIAKINGKLKFKKLQVGGTGGQCLLAPPSFEEGKKYPYFWYNAGGGVLNFLTAGLSLLLLFIGNGYVSLAVGIFAFLGIANGLTNLIPMIIGVPNDGKNIQYAHRDPLSLRCLYLQLAINTDLTNGKKLDELPEEYFDLGDDFSCSNTLIVTVVLMDYYRQLLMENKEKAAHLLSVLMESRFQMGTMIQSVIEAESMASRILEGAEIPEIAAYQKRVAPILSKIKMDIGLCRIRCLFATAFSPEEQEKIAWLSSSTKGALPKTLPRFRPQLPQTLREELQTVYEKQPVFGEAECHLRLADRQIAYLSEITQNNR